MWFWIAQPIVFQHRLCLCKHLSELLNGTIYLDTEYTSGVEGFPGARFVLELNSAPIGLDEESFHVGKPVQSPGTQYCPSSSEESEAKKDKVKSYDSLPEEFKLLFVDGRFK